MTTPTLTTAYVTTYAPKKLPHLKICKGLGKFYSSLDADALVVFGRSMKCHLNSTSMSYIKNLGSEKEKRCVR